MIGTSLAGPHPAADLEAVQVRQAEVEEHDVGRVGTLAGLQRPTTGLVVGHFESLTLESPHQRRGDIGVIFDQKHAHTRMFGTQEQRRCKPGRDAATGRRGGERA